MTVDLQDPFDVALLAEMSARQEKDAARIVALCKALSRAMAELEALKAAKAQPAAPAAPGAP